MFNFKHFKTPLIVTLLPLILSFPVINFDINISPERPSVEFSEGEKSRSKDNFRIRRNFRLKANRAISTWKDLMMYLEISRRMKQFMKETSKKKSEKQ